MMPEQISAAGVSPAKAEGAQPVTLYDDAFYLKQQDVSSRSAACVVPIVISLLPIKSVVDVGCGVGTWAEQFLKRGVQEITGIDGEYVNRQLLRIPPSCFQPRDLGQPIVLNRRFDLAVCMEVAEHLKESRAAGLVEDLTKLADVILFSAAIPGQGGTDHVNEQFLSYWTALFAARDYVLLDLLRPRIWNQAECDWTYRQNAVLFVQKQNPLATSHQVSTGVDYIHPYHYNEVLLKLTKPTLGYLCSSLPQSFLRSLSVRLRRIVGGNAS